MTVIKVSTVDSKCNKVVRVGEWAVSGSRLDVVTDTCCGGFVCGAETYG